MPRASSPKLPKLLAASASLARRVMVEMTGSATLAGHCTAASVFLQELAATHGYALDLVGGPVRVRDDLRGHVWCEFDRLLVDLTARQFWPTAPEALVRRLPATTHQGVLRNEAVWAYVVCPNKVRDQVRRAWDVAEWMEREARAQAGRGIEVRRGDG